MKVLGTALTLVIGFPLGMRNIHSGVRIELSPLSGLGRSDMSPGGSVPPMLNLVAGWLCLIFGVLFTARAVNLLRTEGRQSRPTSRTGHLTVYELLWQGVAVTLLGIGNLLGGRWAYLAGAAVVVIIVIGVRVFVRRLR